MRRIKEYTFKCTGCESEFTLITPETEHPEVCPFCAEDLDNDHEDDEPEDE